MTYHLIGDSTVAACPPYEWPMSGWGPHLSEFISAPVLNHARGGSTTQSFIDDGLWPAVRDAIASHDTVLIGFGHNDQKRRRPDLGAREGFTSRLAVIISETLERGASPVLCTPIERRTFREGALIPSHGDYPNAIRDLAATERVGLVDLTAFTSWLIEDLAEDGSADLFCHVAPATHPHWTEGLDDDTHLHERGARKVAAYVARSLRALERRDGDRPPLGSDYRH